MELKLKSHVLTTKMIITKCFSPSFFSQIERPLPSCPHRRDQRVSGHPAVLHHPGDELKNPAHALHGHDRSGETCP